MNAWSTLPAMLDRAATQHGAARIHFPTQGTDVRLAQLRERSCAFASGLQRRGVGRGDVVGLLAPTSPDFLVAFFGIVAAGAAVAPLPHTAAGAEPPEAHWLRLRSLLAAAEMRHLAVWPHWITPGARAAVGDAVTLLPTDAVGSGPTQIQGSAEPADLAVVQYTSGSTALPRGAALSHANVTACVRAIVSAAAFSAQDVSCQWLPLFHDMGLLGMLSSVAVGATQHLWPPASFVRHPDRWLRAFAARRGTIHAGPNFAYAHMLAAVAPDEARELDLHSWRLAFNGGEPIDPACMAAFQERFAVSGFRPETMFPVYGLAEATVAVTFPPLGQAPGIEWIDRARLAGAGRAVPTEPTAAAARGVVCVGRPVPGLEVRIDGDPAPGQIGEILVRGASVMREYYRAPAATEERLAAGWLRTGDLGYLRDGGLYVTGRRKQMIVVNGVNHYPEDVEAVARGAPGLHRQRCIAFGLEGLERILLLAEAHSTDPVETAILAARLYRCITTSLELYDVGVHVVRKNTLRRTTSGKYQRLLMRDLLTRGALSRSVLASYPPPAEPGAHATADVAAAEVLR